jgi:hypothetical protein
MCNRPFYAMFLGPRLALLRISSRPSRARCGLKGKDVSKDGKNPGIPYYRNCSFSSLVGARIFSSQVEIVQLRSSSEAEHVGCPVLELTVCSSDLNFGR